MKKDYNKARAIHARYMYELEKVTCIEDSF